MSNDEIIEMAREIATTLGSRMCDENGDTHGEELYCMAFDDIVDSIKLVAAKEREACAKVSEEKGLFWKTRHDINPDNAEKAYMASQFIADAIRTRGEA